MSRVPGIGVFCAAVLGSSLLFHAAAAEKNRLLEISDLYRLDTPHAVTLSPDGRRAVYSRHWIDARTRQERTSLWLVEGTREKRRPLEKGEPDARSPVFSPDGKWIVFLSTRAQPAGWKQTPAVPPASDPATGIWAIPAAGGTAVPLGGAQRPYGRVFNDGFYGRVVFSPDGRKLAFVADDGKDPRGPDEIANDVLVVRPDQGEGYTGYGPAQVWVAHLDLTPEHLAVTRIDRLTDDDIWYGDPQWSPDGRTLVVHANKTRDRESVRYSINKNFDLWAIDVDTRAVRQLTAGIGPEVSPRFSPDGKRLACLSVPRQGSHRDVFNLAIVPSAAMLSRREPAGPGPYNSGRESVPPGQPLHVLFDHHGSDSDRPPHPAPAFPLPEDCWEGESMLYYNGESGTGSGLVRVEISTGRGQFLMPFAGAPAGPPRTVLQRAMVKHRLTPRSNEFLKDRELGASKVVTWKNGAQTLEGILTVPPAGLGKAPHKLVVHPHGGPHSRSVLGFDFTVQILAAHGYAVFQPNFRGSSGYGQKFIDADRADLGGGDMTDIMTGVDHLIREKLADPDRLFVYGTSYGGFMTCWLVGQTNRFRAAVAQNAVTDLNMMWGLSDLHSWTHWEFGGFPWEVPDLMRKHSPLTHVAKVQTPTLILHARDDRRCPLPMGKAFYQSLVARNVPTQMVIYPDEGHGIRQPRHREDVLRRVVAWFERY